MTAPQLSNVRPVLGRLLLTLSACVVYFGVPAIHGGRITPLGHFQRLAEAFLAGDLSMEVEPGHRGELIPVAGGDRYYCAYPPLPAVLLMPFVFVFGSAVKVDFACRVVSVVNVWLMDACLSRLPVRLGREPLSHSARLSLTALFGFGTAAWHNADFGGDWHLAHAVAVCAMLLALREFLGSSRPLVVGTFVALALLARPTTAFTSLFFVPPLFRKRVWADLIRFVSVPMFAVILLGAYNFARFGSVFDFGYDRMTLEAESARLMALYGQFDQAYLFRNFFWYFLAPPWIREDCAFPWMGYDPRGLSLLIASPAMLYAIVALRRDWRLSEVRHAALAIAACLVPLLLYFNTGFWQFGQRFSLDYLSILIMLVVVGMGRKPSARAYGLIGLSIMIQAWGVVVDSFTRLPEWMIPTV